MNSAPCYLPPSHPNHSNNRRRDAAAAEPYCADGSADYSRTVEALKEARTERHNARAVIKEMRDLIREYESLCDDCETVDMAALIEAFDLPEKLLRAFNRVRAV